MTTQPTGWERREVLMLRVVPYCTLAISAVLTLMADSRTWTHASVTAGLTALAAAWTFVMVDLRPEWRERQGLMGAYYAGHTALATALIIWNPLFGFFAWSGYVQVAYLQGRRQWAGVAATAVLVSVTYIGGFQNLHGSSIALFAVFVVASAALGGAFMYYGTRSNEQRDHQRTMLAQLAEANAQLEAALAENAGLHAQLLAQAREGGVMDERQRMAREIHDTLAQGFTGIIAQLEAARQNSDQWRRFTDQAQSLARENLAEARRSVRALQPGHLEGAHLPDAIAGMSERWSKTSGVAVGVETTGEPRPMLADVEVALFRVAQEALTNVAKHAMASRVGLTLSYMDDVVLLDVRDDGVGFEPAANGDGFGLTSMRQRLLRVAGSLAVESSPGDGTAVNASVPALPAGGDA